MPAYFPYLPYLSRASIKGIASQCIGRVKLVTKFASGLICLASILSKIILHATALAWTTPDRPSRRQTLVQIRALIRCLLACPCPPHQIDICLRPVYEAYRTW